jgi:hypothetical protein
MAKWIRITGARITGARYWEHGIGSTVLGARYMGSTVLGARYMGRIDIFKIKDARLWKIFNLLGTSI